MSSSKMHFIKTAIVWPTIAGVMVYSLKAPGENLVAVFFFSSLLILMNSTEREEKWVCGVMLAFQVVIAAHVLFKSPALYNAPSLWIACRLLYVIGLAIFLPPLVEEKLKLEKWQTKGVVVAFLLILVAFYFYNKDREAKQVEPVRCISVKPSSKDDKYVCQPDPDPEPWYSTSSLIDDIAFGVGGGLLIGSLNLAERRKVLGEEKKKLRPRRRALFEALGNKTK